MIVKFFNWDRLKNVNCRFSNIKAGEIVVIDHEWGGLFLAEVILVDKSIEREESAGEVIRKATSQDREMVMNNQKQEKAVLRDVKKELREFKVDMKVIETKLSIDCKCLLIVFIADGRIDFRELVKKLSNKYQKIVRFQQIGSRDEARNIGGYGICGREICCRKFPGILKSISSNMAEDQAISHRGSDRLSGLCGRLMCCLAFEVEQYQKDKKDKELAEKTITKNVSNKIKSKKPTKLSQR